MLIAYALWILSGVSIIGSVAVLRDNAGGAYTLALCAAALFVAPFALATAGLI